MTKEEKIKEAWGEYYIIVKNQIDNNGWYKYFDLNNSEMKRKLWQFGNLELEELSDVYLIRPKSLQGIENNNGWIKIESEEDLPKEGKEVHVVIYGETIKKNCSFIPSRKVFFRYGDVDNVTHWKDVEKPKPPIY